MSERKRLFVRGVEVYRAGTRWSWAAVGYDWSWANVGSGGHVRSSHPQLMAADVGHWCESIDEAVIYSVGFGEGYAAAALPPGGRLTVPINAKPAGSPPPPPAPPPPAPPPPPLATPVDPQPPKGGKP